MRVVYSDEEVPDTGLFMSLFLAGPTPRKKDVPSWRPEAIEILSKLNFSGIVFVPERRNWTGFDYLDQVEWEWKALESCAKVVFWVPRNLETMPAFTTNVEFGRHVVGSIYGRPDGCPGNKYLDWLYQKVNYREPFNDLTTMLEHVVEWFWEIKHEYLDLCRPPSRRRPL